MCFSTHQQSSWEGSVGSAARGSTGRRFELLMRQHEPISASLSSEALGTGSGCCSTEFGKCWYSRKLTEKRLKSQLLNQSQVTKKTAVKLYSNHLRRMLLQIL